MPWSAWTTMSPADSDDALRALLGGEQARRELKQDLRLGVAAHRAQRGAHDTAEVDGVGAGGRNERDDGTTRGARASSGPSPGVLTDRSGDPDVPGDPHLGERPAEAPQRSDGVGLRQRLRADCARR